MTRNDGVRVNTVATGYRAKGENKRDDGRVVCVDGVCRAWVFGVLVQEGEHGEGGGEEGDVHGGSSKEVYKGDERGGGEAARPRGAERGERAGRERRGVGAVDGTRGTHAHGSRYGR